MYAVIFIIIPRKIRRGIGNKSKNAEIDEKTLVSKCQKFTNGMERFQICTFADTNNERI